MGENLTGGWEPERGIRLSPTRYPRWTAYVQGLPANATIEWKCMRRREEGGRGEFAGGANGVLRTNEGFAGTVTGRF